VRDVLDISLGWLLRGEKAGTLVFDTGSDDAIEVGDLARLIAQLMGKNDMPIERPAGAGKADDCYLGDARAMAALAAEQGLVLADLRTQVRETVRYLTEQR
jgi:hypothetical protein